jgi:SNF2 family DNA or RNA helicase
MSHSVEVKLDQDTFLTSIIFDNGEEATFNSLILFLNTLPNITYTSNGYILSWHYFKKNITTIARILKINGIDVHFDNYSQSLIDMLLDDRDKYEHNKHFLTISENDLVKKLADFGFSRQLTLEQKRDVLRLLELKHGANFSVPGAGKTTSLLAVHTILRLEGIVDILFVVCPINAFISWEDEVNIIYEKNRPKIIRLKVSDLENFHTIIQQNPDIILVNYEKLRKNLQVLFSFFIRNKVHLVLDESHRIKGGENNLSYQQLINLADLAIRRDILSGTPMPQSVMDLDPQFEYLWSRNILDPFISRNPLEDQIQIANSKIKNLFVRTTKAELGLKPPKIKYHHIEMGTVQSELYELFRSEAARQMSGVETGTKDYMRNIGKSVVGLLQAATNPMLLGTEDEFFQETLAVPSDTKAWDLLREYSRYEKAAKIEYLTNRVNEILKKDPKNKIVIWSYFVRNVKLLEKLFWDFSPVSIYGAIPSGTDTDEDTREQRIRKFHEDPFCRLMIANPQAGGEGISLHRVCHYAIYLDRTFNAAHYLQSVDRIHRLGLPNSVNTFIEIIIAKNTIDEVVLKRLNIKTKSMSKVLDDPGLLKLAYDPEDLEDNGLGLDKEDINSISEHLLHPND